MLVEVIVGVQRVESQDSTEMNTYKRKVVLNLPGGGSLIYSELLDDVVWMG